MATTSELQDQIYIISGVFGGVCSLLLIVVIILAVKVANLKKKSKGGVAVGVARGGGGGVGGAGGGGKGRQDVVDFNRNNDGVDELARRGFSAYTGQQIQQTPAGQYGGQQMRTGGGGMGYNNPGYNNPGQQQQFQRSASPNQSNFMSQNPLNRLPEGSMQMMNDFAQDFAADAIGDAVGGALGGQLEEMGVPGADALGGLGGDFASKGAGKMFGKFGKKK